MTLQQLKYIITIADCNLMNKAAGQLFISQPSLSAAVRELAEEVLSTYEYKIIIKAEDRATFLNLMKGLNAYTLCSGIICEELNGGDYRAVPLDIEEMMTIGYIKRKGIPLSGMGKLYIDELAKYEKQVL